MGNVIVVNHVTLDGVMQAPGRADEDTRDGFAHGGWAAPANDEVMGRKMGEGMGAERSMLFGRRTYEDFSGFWPQQTDNPFTEVLEKAQKYVVSTTLDEPLPWANSTVLREPTRDVATLRRELDTDLIVLGSGELVRTLLAGDLIDRFVLMIHPLVLGTGRRLFAEAGTLARLRLTDATPTTTGVLIATYERGAS